MPVDGGACTTCHSRPARLPSLQPNMAVLPIQRSRRVVPVSKRKARLSPQATRHVAPGEAVEWGVPVGGGACTSCHSRPARFPSLLPNTLVLQFEPSRRAMLLTMSEARVCNPYSRCWRFAYSGPPTAYYLRRAAKREKYYVTDVVPFSAAAPPDVTATLLRVLTGFVS